jgi:nitrogen regulatory protein PII
MLETDNLTGYNFQPINAKYGDNTMKMITAIIDPDKLDALHDELKKTGINYIVTMEAKASAVEGGFTERYRGATYVTDYYDFARVDIVIDDEKLDSAIKTVLDVTGGDKAIGRIFTSTIDDAINIATHKTGVETAA